jgi:NTP pyrophosphatase (non-canonical NTP hydrolase)
MNPDLATFLRRIKRFARERDWEQFHTPKNLAMALSVEASEVVELFQWLTEEESRKLPETKVRALADELADTYIYLLMLRALQVLQQPLGAEPDELDVLILDELMLNNTHRATRLDPTSTTRHRRSGETHVLRAEAGSRRRRERLRGALVAQTDAPRSARGHRARTQGAPHPRATWSPLPCRG